MTRLRLHILTAVACVAMALCSCNSDVVYDKYNHTQLTGWEKNDTLAFDVPPMKESGRYRLELGLRTSTSFPFTGLSLVVDRTVEPGHMLYTDTVNCRLADDKGNVLGRGVSCFQYSFIVSDIDLRRGDSLHICVRHIMKREIMPGISDIGLKISKR